MSEQGNTPGPKMTLGDVLYIVFRHKWKIVLIAVAGIVGAQALPLIQPPEFQSQAKLYISYVLENKTPTQVGENAPPSSMWGDSVINTELEILKSQDLAQQVADDIGPEKILARFGGGTNRLDAGRVIAGKLTAEVARSASVIHLTYKHRDPDLPQIVLERLITFYYAKHAEIHNPGAFNDLLTEETKKLHSQLQITKDDLRKAKENLKISGSLDQSKKSYADRITILQQNLFDAEVELTSREAELAVMKRLQPDVSASPANDDSAVNTTNPVEIVAVPREKEAEYKRVLRELEALNKREQEYLQIYTPESILRRSVRSHIETCEKEKQRLEREHPGLLAVKTFEPRGGVPSQAANPQNNYVAAMAGAAALKSKIEKLSFELKKLTADAQVLERSGDTIQELQNRIERDETFYRQMMVGLLAMQWDKRISAERVSMRDVQRPSAPVPAKSKLQKLKMMVLAGGIAGGFALAFLIELYLDPSIKRPVDIENRLRIPLFISIPRFSSNGKSKAVQAGKKTALLADSGVPDSHTDEQGGAGGQPDKPATVACNLELTASDPAHSVRPFCNGLRDRLMTHFELRNLTHKPKMVAVTSCAEGCGVSTVAAGLAASLSETGDGNVLLVELNPQASTVRPFFKGRQECGLEEVLTADKRGNALIQDRLYVATEAGDQDLLPSVFPKRLGNLVPRLRASDYDYIIFDMPPVNQISMTARMAKLMDMVLMVVESERTNQEVAKRANALLAQSKAEVALVLNKTRNYVPKFLHQEF